jgi:PAS domain S-box-containing protein
MSIKQKRRLPFYYLTVPAYAGYITFFLVFYPFIGESAAIFAFVPPLVVAWIAGTRRGIVSSIIADVITLILLDIERVPSWDAASILHRSPGLVSVIVIAVIVGYMSDLRKRLNRELDLKNKIEKELRESESMLRGIYLAAPVGISLSKNRIMQTVNGWLYEISGFSAEEIIGNNARMYYVDDAEYKRVGRELYENREKGGSSYAEARWRRKDGAVIDVSLRMSPINPDDLSAGEVVTVLDITKRKKAEQALAESEKSFRNMFELTSEGASLIRPITNRIVAANPAMCALFGYTEEEFLTLTAEDITPLESNEIMRNSLKLLSDGGDVPDHEGTSLKKDGTKVNVIVCCRQLLWKNELVFYVTFKDVTFLKDVQRQLEKKNREILEFTNAATHDLKKPLTTMKTVCSLMQTGAFGNLNSDGKEATGMGAEAISYMQELLDDLLASAQLDAGTQELTLEEIDLRALALEAVARLKYPIEEKKVAVTIDDELGMVMADKKGMTKVFMNLIGNAINYIGDGPDRKIVIGAKKTDGMKVFYVRDNGMGIPEESRKTIFEKFKRGANVKNISGTGLGLSIVKGTVEAHGGKIWAESKVGEGTTFYFDLAQRNSLL